MKALAIILARAGSKGLPRKNMLPVGPEVQCAGRRIRPPCAFWTLRHAIDSHAVGAIALSTDDDELKTLARDMDCARELKPQRTAAPGPGPMGGEGESKRLWIVDRPAELAGDRATIDAAARHAVNQLEHELPELRNPRAPIAILYANVPVRPPDLTDRALAELANDRPGRPPADSVQSYLGVGKHHPWWTARIDPDSAGVSPWEGNTLNHGVFRRQDLPPAFIPDGGVIAVTREALMLEIQSGVSAGPHAFFGRDDRRRGIVSADRADAVVDVDNRIDLLVADALLNERAGAKG